MNNTIDENRESKYWNKYRINKSASYQYDVYKFASSLVSGKKDKVVDIGCGPATKLVKIIGKKTKNIIGLDQDSAIQFCKKQYKFGSFYKVDLESVGNNFNKVQNPNLIICSDVIEHLINPDNLLRLIKKIANQNTHIVISTPDRDKLRGESCMKSNKKEHIRE